VPGTYRDLASAELWQDSLERSQRRRVLAADARKDQTRKKTASVAVTAAVAAAPMWPSMTATAADLSTEEAGKVAKKLQDNQPERILLEVGDTSTAVAELQRKLGIPDDGIFGPQTQGAVRAFQKKEKLLPTGKVDVKTWLKLFPTDMIVYAPPGSASALGVNDTDHPEWAAISAKQAAAAGETVVPAAAHGKTGKKKHARREAHASVRAASAGIGGLTPPSPNAGGPQGAPGVGGIPGVLGGIVAPNGGGGGGGGGGGSFHFPPLSKFGSAKEMISAMIKMANRIDSHHYAYSWGGGHNSSFSGPYDCSGAVSAVLHAAGLLNRPMVSGEFMHWGAPGRGAVTIYANAGHVYMSILGKYFGTTHANPGGGAGWFPGAPRAGFAVVHVPFSALHLKGHKKKHKKKRHKRRHHRRHRAQQQGPLNQPEPQGTTGGQQAAPPSSSPPPSSTPTATPAAQSYSPPGGSTPATTQVPNPQPAPAPQPVATAPQSTAVAPTGVAPTAPAAPAPNPQPVAAPPAQGPAGTPGSTPTPNDPAPASRPTVSPGGSGGPQQAAPAPAPKPAPVPSAAPAQQAIDTATSNAGPAAPQASQTGQAASQAAADAAQKSAAPKPPAASNGQGSQGNSSGK
jgi:hypothetical protein